MTRFAFIWIIVSVGFALWFHAHEEAQRRADIDHATRRGLAIGVRAGCKSNNDIRDEVTHLAERLHPTLVVKLDKQNCRWEVGRVLHAYQERVDGGK